MTYKDTLFFVGKCLTINHEEHNRKEVEKELKSGLVNWDNVVKVSTSHYVFPALYCNLKKANFLDYLPNDLVEYMQHITDLNRERNEQIIEQAKEINELLLENNITPIFLKGTGNLLSGLYDDIAERMVGDIDVLFDSNSIYKAYKILTNNGYSSPYKYYPEYHRHLEPIIHEYKISRIEIHKEIIKTTYSNYFNYELIKDTIIKKKGISFLSYENQLSLSIISKQINDDGQYYNNISLRNAYDVFLLSQKVNSKNSIISLAKKIKIPLNNFLAITQLTFNSKKIHFINDKKSAKHITVFIKIISDERFSKKHNKKWKLKLLLNSRIEKVIRFFYKKEYFFWFLKRLFQGNPRK